MDREHANYRTANKQLIKEINMTLVLQMVRELGPISRADISKRTGLNPATVSSHLQLLLEHGVVRETGSGESSGGRKPTLLALVPDAYYAVAVDMGTTKVQAALVNLAGHVKRKLEIPFGESRTPQTVLAVMEDAVRQLLNGQSNKSDEEEGQEQNDENLSDDNGECNDEPHDKGMDTDQHDNTNEKERILGIGIGFHGLVDPERGVSLFAPAFQWTDVAVAERFEQSFSLPVIVDKDARAMAFAEKWFGAAKEIDDFIFLNIGTGVGSGIYAHGRLITGSGFGAGEIGHIPLVNNGIRCYCGQIGCLHTVATGPAIERRARAHMDHQEASMMRKLADGDPYQVDGALVSHAARAGDQIARQILREAGMYIGRALAMAVNLLNPSCIFIGGGVSRARELILDSIVQEIKKRSMRQHVENIRVELATFGDHAGVVGAATLVLADFFQNPLRYFKQVAKSYHA